jgi:DNA-directed RNA polymerase subunit omega
MARVTVEDCIDKIPNRFDLVILSAERVREILSGAPVKVVRENDKMTVIALREIAGSYVNPQTLRENLITANQKVTPIAEDEDILDFIEEEQSWVNNPESQEMQQEIQEDDLHLEDEETTDEE